MTQTRINLMVRVLEHVKAHVKVVTLVGKYKRKFYFYVWTVATKVFVLSILLENIN